MAGTVVLTETTFAPVKKIKFAWTCSAGGLADKITVNSFFGQVLAMVTIPDSGTAPTALYDITITDAEGYDVMQGAGANRSATVTETAVPTATSVAHGTLTLNITNAGASKLGVVVLYIR